MNQNVKSYFVLAGPVLGGLGSIILHSLSPLMYEVYIATLFGYQMWIIWRWHVFNNNSRTFTMIALSLIALTFAHLFVHGMFQDTEQFESHHGKDAVVHFGMTALGVLPFHLIQDLQVDGHWNHLRKVVEYVILPLMAGFIVIEWSPYHGQLIAQGVLGLLCVPGFVFRMIVLPTATWGPVHLAFSLDFMST